jgi:hypothetical protein
MSFTRSLSVKGDLEEIINEEARATSLVLLRDVVISTPVDTGRARGNWQVDLFRFADGEVDLLDRGGSIAIQRGAARINDARAVKYPTITLSNNLPYIGKLNQGSSTQAPKMFVESAIIRAVNRN